MGCTSGHHGMLHNNLRGGYHGRDGFIPRGSTLIPRRVTGGVLMNISGLRDVTISCLDNVFVKIDLPGIDIAVFRAVVQYFVMFHCVWSALVMHETVSSNRYPVRDRCQVQHLDEDLCQWIVPGSVRRTRG